MMIRVPSFALRAVFAALLLSTTAQAKTATTVDLSGYESGGPIAVENPDPDTLVVTWPDNAGDEFRIAFNLEAGQPLLRSIAAKSGGGGIQECRAGC